MVPAPSAKQAWHTTAVEQRNEWSEQGRWGIHMGLDLWRGLLLDVVRCASIVIQLDTGRASEFDGKPAVLVPSRRAAPNCALGDLTGGNKSIDTALREFGAHGSHALRALRAVLVIGAAVSQVVAGAGTCHGFAVGEGRGGENGKAC